MLLADWPQNCSWCRREVSSLVKKRGTSGRKRESKANKKQEIPKPKPNSTTKPHCQGTVAKKTRVKQPALTLSNYTLTVGQ